MGDDPWADDTCTCPSCKNTYHPDELTAFERANLEWADLRPAKISPWESPYRQQTIAKVDHAAKAGLIETPVLSVWHFADIFGKPRNFVTLAVSYDGKLIAGSNVKA